MNVKILKYAMKKEKSQTRILKNFTFTWLIALNSFFNFLCYLYLQLLVEEMLKPEEYQKMNYHLSGFRGTYRLRNRNVLSKKSVNQISTFNERFLFENVWNKKREITATIRDN